MEVIIVRICDETLVPPGYVFTVKMGRFRFETYHSQFGVIRCSLSENSFGQAPVCKVSKSLIEEQKKTDILVCGEPVQCRWYTFDHKHVRVALCQYVVLNRNDLQLLDFYPGILGLDYTIP